MHQSCCTVLLYISICKLLKYLSNFSLIKYYYNLFRPCENDNAIIKVDNEFELKVPKTHGFMYVIVINYQLSYKAL